MPIGTAQRIYYRAKKAAQIQHGKGIHTLRHCFATHLLEGGTDIPTIQALMGHRWIGTTMMYVRISRRHLASVRSPFDLIPIGALPPIVLE
jgi:site-specific recombinase XerD